MKTYQWSTGIDGGYNGMASWSRYTKYQWLITVGDGAFMSVFIGVTDDYGDIQPVRKF